MKRLPYRWRRRLASLLCILIYLPLLPFALLYVGVEALANLLDWMLTDRPWSLAIGRLADRIEVAFGVDNDTMYEEWKERRAAKARARE